MQSLLVAGLAFLSVVVAGNLALTLVLVRRINRMPSPVGPPLDMEIGLKQGVQAPDFQAATLSGETVTLADYANQAVSLIFLSTHCPPCVEKLPALQTLAPKAGTAGVELVLVLGEDEAAAATFVEQHQIALPVLVAPHSNSTFIADYKSFAVPSYCTLNQRGQVEAAGLLEPGWEQQLTRDWTALGQAPRSQQQALASAGA